MTTPFCVDYWSMALYLINPDYFKQWEQDRVWGRGGLKRNVWEMNIQSHDPSLGVLTHVLDSRALQR